MYTAHIHLILLHAGLAKTLTSRLFFAGLRLLLLMLLLMLLLLLLLLCGVSVQRKKEGSHNSSHAQTRAAPAGGLLTDINERQNSRSSSRDIFALQPLAEGTFHDVPLQQQQQQQQQQIQQQQQQQQQQQPWRL